MSIRRKRQIIASTLPSAGGKPWRIHSGHARPRRSYGNRLWRRWRAIPVRSRDARRSGGGRRDGPHPRAQDQHKLLARLVVRMRRPPLRWLAPLVCGVPLFESAMGDEQRRGRDIAMVAGRRWCASAGARRCGRCARCARSSAASSATVLSLSKHPGVRGCATGPPLDESEAHQERQDRSARRLEE